MLEGTDHNKNIIAIQIIQLLSRHKRDAESGAAITFLSRAHSCASHTNPQDRFSLGLSFSLSTTVFKSKQGVPYLDGDVRGGARPGEAVPRPRGVQTVQQRLALHCQRLPRSPHSRLLPPWGLRPLNYLLQPKWVRLWILCRWRRRRLQPAARPASWGCHELGCAIDLRVEFLPILLSLQIQSDWFPIDRARLVFASLFCISCDRFAPPDTED